MKILIAIPYFYPKVGGLENYAFNILTGLKNKYRYEIVVVSSNHVSRQYTVETIHGMKVYRLPYWIRASNTPINLGWFIDIFKIIKKEKPDIINGHTPVPFIADVAAFISKLLKIPFILTYQNDLIKGNILDYPIQIYYRTIGEIIFNLSKKIIVSSQYYSDNSIFLKNFKNKVTVIAPGVHIISHEQNKDREANKKTILFVGQLDKTHLHKGLTYLIASMKYILISIPKAKLIVVGKGDYIEDYKKIAKQQGVIDHITFKGYLDDEALVNEYQKSSVVVLPSITDSEGFGMTLIEAGAYHKPVVGTRVGGIPSIIKDNFNGFLVPPKNPKTLSKTLLHILNDSKLAKRLGENGYSEVLKKYLWELQVDKTKILFNQQI